MAVFSLANAFNVDESVNRQSLATNMNTIQNGSFLLTVSFIGNLDSSRAVLPPGSHNFHTGHLVTCGLDIIFID